MEVENKMKNATGTPVHSADRLSFNHHDQSISNLPASFLRRAVTLMMTLLLMLCFSTAAFAAFSHASEAQPIALESSVEAEISVGGDYVYYSFVPAASGTYYFFSSGDEDTYAYLYDSNGTQLAYDDDGGTNTNFKISYQFEAGKQYYLGAKFYSSSTTGSFTVHLESFHGLISATTADGSSYSNVNVAFNETATMTVYATCTEGDSLHYAWYDYGYNLIEGANEATYTSEPVTSTCNYSCTVSDDYGNAQTVYFYVRIDNALTVEGGYNTRVVTVQPHGTATLSVVASCRNGDLSYAWRDNNGSTLSSTTNTLVLENVNNSAYYSCTVSDQYGNSITADFSVQIDNELRIDGSSEARTVIVQPHGTATLKVVASCRDGDLSYIWQSSSGNTLDNTNNTLVLEDVSSVAYYYCIVKDQYGNSATVPFYIQIDNAFVVKGGNATRTITVQPHENVTLTVAASCRDGDLSYTWRDDNWNTMGSTTETLTLENVISTEYYSCRVEDQYGNSSETRFRIRVDNAFSVEGRDGTQYVYVPYGGATTLNAVASCRDGVLSYQWYQNGTRLSDETSPNLQIAEVTRAENYYCSISDQYGNNATVGFQVGVENGFYAWAVGTMDRFLPENAVTTLSVQAGCTTGELSYEWRRDETGQVMGTTDTITSAPVTTGYDGYRCRVSDQYGNFKDIYFDLHLDNELRIWAVSENPVYLSKKSDVTMTVGADCKNGEVSYQWGRVEKDTDRSYTYLGTFAGPEGATFTARAVDSACYYYCTAVDQYQNRSTIYFDIVWDNNFTTPAHNPLRLVNPGESVTLSTNVTCASGNLSYQWIEAPLNGYSDYNDVISTERALTVSCDQSKTYRCFVQDEYGNGTDYTFIILVKQSTEAIALNQLTEVATTVNLQGKAFTFTPAVTGSYQFSGHGNTPLCAAMMRDDGVQWYYTGVTQYNDFSNFMKLEAGRTYTYYAMSTVLNSSFEVYLELLEAEVQHAQNQLILPAGTKRIDEGAFAGIGAEEVVLPDGCEYISAGAFADCPNLRLINIPDSVTFIADSAFAGCNVSLIQDGRSNYARQYAVNHGLGWIVPEN